MFTLHLAMNMVFISVSVMITISMVILSEMFDCDFDNLEEFLSFSLSWCSFEILMSLVQTTISWEESQKITWRNYCRALSLVFFLQLKMYKHSLLKHCEWCWLIIWITDFKLLNDVTVRMNDELSYNNFISCNEYFKKETLGRYRSNMY